MRRGVLLLAIASVSGCAAPVVQATAVHPVGVPPIPLNGSTGERVAYADGQFALGNVALALESYRRASRQEPDSVRALLGMAQCYDAMGRFDLARRTYESALALAPSEAAILARLATSLTSSGDLAGAAQLRREIASRSTSSVTVALPAAAPEQAETAAEPMASAPAVTVALADAPLTVGPHLERLSLGEVALVTTGSVRWAALQPAEGVGGGVRILNAARRAGLAAQTRTALLRLGWRRLSIGDAPVVRQSSLVLYPASRRQTAERLARQIGAMTLRPSHGDEIVMLLGRDVTAAAGPRAGP